MLGHGMPAIRDGDHLGLRSESGAVFPKPAEPEGDREGERGDPVVVVPGEHSPILLGHEVVQERLRSAPLFDCETEEVGQPFVAYFVCLVQPEIYAVRALLHDRPELLGQVLYNGFMLAFHHTLLLWGGARPDDRAPSVAKAALRARG